MNARERSELDYTEKLLKAIVEQNGVEKFFVAVHNVFSHGEGFQLFPGDEEFLGKGDKNLGEFFSNLDTLREIFKS